MVLQSCVTMAARPSQANLKSADISCGHALARIGSHTAARDGDASVSAWGGWRGLAQATGVHVSCSAGFDVLRLHKGAAAVAPGHEWFVHVTAAKGCLIADRTSERSLTPGYLKATCTFLPQTILCIFSLTIHPLIHLSSLGETRPTSITFHPPRP